MASNIITRTPFSTAAGQARAGITERLAALAARRPWAIVCAWLLILLLGGFFAMGIGDVLSTASTQSGNPESAQANSILNERLPEFMAANELVVVRSATSSVDDPSFQQFTQQLVADIRALPGVVSGVTDYYETPSERLVSSDRHSLLVPVRIVGDADDSAKTAGPLLTYLERAGDGQFEVLSAGVPSINRMFDELAQKDLQRGEAVALPIAIVILALVFGALVAAGIPLLVAVVSIVIAIGAAALVGQMFSLSFFVENMITMIGLAVGVDYSLFIIHRYREERSRGLTVEQAVTRAGATAGRAVMFSGGTVVIGLAGLFIVPSSVYRSLAIGAILVASVAVMAATTLLPALLRLLGDRVNAIRFRLPIRLRPSGSGSIWERMTSLVLRHPVVSTVASIALLVGAAAPVLGLETGVAGVTSLPVDTEPRRAFALLSSEFSGGLVAPANIVIEGPTSDTRVQASTRSLTQSLASDSRFGQPQVTSDDHGSLTLLTVPVNADPSSPRAHQAVNDLRDTFIPAAFSGTPADVLVTGTTAEAEDMFQTIDFYTPIVFAFVLGLSFVLLLVVFRSIIVPLKAIIMNLLSVGAAYGLLVLVFQHGVGAGLLGFQRAETIEAWLPLFLFSVLFGLSMDYHVFLLSRIKEHFDLNGDNSAAVAFGVRSTSGLITGAALIMVAVFGGFARGELSPMQQLGFGLAVSVILDATVIRSVLVPASMRLLGDRNWYLPSWLGWLPRFELESNSRPTGPLHQPV